MTFTVKKIGLVAVLLGYLVSLAFGASYLMTHQLPHLLLGVLSFLISNCLMALMRLRQRLIHMLFYLMIFIFLLSRPTIQVFREGYLIAYQPEVYEFAFSLVWVMLIGLAIGDGLGEWFSGIGRLPLTLPPADTYTKTLRKVSMIGFCLTYPFYVMRLVAGRHYRQYHP